MTLQEIYIAAPEVLNTVWWVVILLLHRHGVLSEWSDDRKSNNNYNYSDKSNGKCAEH